MKYKKTKPRDVRLSEKAGIVLFELCIKTQLSYRVIIENALEYYKKMLKG